MSDEPAPEHTVPIGVDEATVAAVGKLTEALETTERARGHLYTFHQLTGTADLQLGDAVAGLREAGHDRLAGPRGPGHVRLPSGRERELVGRNVLPGRWTFQVMEDYDDTYWSVFRGFEKEAR